MSHRRDLQDGAASHGPKTQTRRDEDEREGWCSPFRNTRQSSVQNADAQERGPCIKHSRPRRSNQRAPCHETRRGAGFLPIGPAPRSCRQTDAEEDGSVKDDWASGLGQSRFLLRWKEQRVCIHAHDVLHAKEEGGLEGAWVQTGSRTRVGRVANLARTEYVCSSAGERRFGYAPKAAVHHRYSLHFHFHFPRRPSVPVRQEGVRNRQLASKSQQGWYAGRGKRCRRGARRLQAADWAGLAGGCADCPRLRLSRRLH